MYPSRLIDVTFIIKNEQGEEIERINRMQHYTAAEEVAEAAGQEESVMIKTTSDDDAFWEREVMVSLIDNVERWALHEQDGNAGVDCAECGEEIGYEEGCSSPSGSMHKGCASQHESRNPAIW